MPDDGLTQAYHLLRKKLGPRWRVSYYPVDKTVMAEREWQNGTKDTICVDHTITAYGMRATRDGRTIQGATRGSVSSVASTVRLWLDPAEKTRSLE